MGAGCSTMREVAILRPTSAANSAPNVPISDAYTALLSNRSPSFYFRPRAGFGLLVSHGLKSEIPVLHAKALL